MRDALFLPFDEEELVITTDNSGVIGEKMDDIVKVPYDVVSYFSFRVAIMEMLASRAKPLSVILQNFCGDSAWERLVLGIEKGLIELDMGKIPITGSTESNFELHQSAMGLSIIGRRKVMIEKKQQIGRQQMALIGLPLVGDEVMEQPESIVPLSLVKELSTLNDVRIWPVGSKGVWHELQRMIPNVGKEPTHSNIDLRKSGGPSTSMLVQYPLEKEAILQKHMGECIHHVVWEGEV